MSSSPSLGFAELDVASSLKIAEEDPVRVLSMLRADVVESDQRPLVHVARGKALMQLGDLAGATKEIDVALEFVPPEPEARRVAAMLAMRQGFRERALQFAEEGVELAPTNLELLELLVRLQEGEGQTVAAVATRRKIVALRPDDAGLITLLGSALLNQGATDEALSCYRRAIALAPNNPGPQYGASLALAKLGRVKDAISAVKTAIEFSPDVSEYYANLGHWLANVGLVGDAAAAFERAIELHPQNLGIRHILADLLDRLGRYGDALHHSQKVIEMGGKEARFYVQLGRLLTSRGRFAEAVKPLAHATLLAPDDAPLHEMLAQSYEQLARFEDAAAELRQVLRIRPTHAVASHGLSRHLERMGDLPGALIAIEAGLSKTDPQAILHEEKARLLRIQTGEQFTVVPLRYAATEVEELIAGREVTTQQGLVYTNFLDMNPEGGRGHLEALYVKRTRQCPSVSLYSLASDAKVAVPQDEEFIPFIGHRVIAEQINPAWKDHDLASAIELCTREGHIDEPCILIGRRGIRTWGHWLGELLPKVIAVESRRPGQFRYLFPEIVLKAQVHRTLVESLDYYGIGPDRLVSISPDTIYRVPQLYAVSSAWSPDHMVHPGAMELMRTSGIHGAEPAPGGRKVALLRRSTQTRGIANLAELERVLTERGWVVVDIEDMNFTQQVELFRGADAVASVLGSNLTGVIYAPLGVKIMTLAPSHWGDRFFLSLMMEREASIADIRGRSTAIDIGDVATAKFHVRPAAIERGLAALELCELSRNTDSRLSRQSSEVHRASRAPVPSVFDRSAQQLQDAPLVVTVEHEAPKLGDTLNTLPFILTVAQEFNRPVHVQGKFSAAVRELVSNLPISFESAATVGPRIEYRLNVLASWNYAGPRGLHMCQGYFALAAMPLPEVPISIPFKSEPCPLPSGIVVSPFNGARQDPQQIGLWSVEKWNVLIETLLAADPNRNIYVIGDSRDDACPFLRDGVIPVLGYPLTQVLDLMQRSDLCITVDTGTSHLAHFGMIEHHVLLYPEVNFKNLHSNPRGKTIQGWPRDISVEMVLDAIRAPR